MEAEPAAFVALTSKVIVDRNRNGRLRLIDLVIEEGQGCQSEAKCDACHNPNDCVRR